MSAPVGKALGRGRSLLGLQEGMKCLSLAVGDGLVERKWVVEAFPASVQPDE